MSRKAMWTVLAGGFVLSIALSIQLLSAPRAPKGPGTAGKAEPQEHEAESTASKAPELSAGERAARALAAQGIDAQPADIQQRFYEGHLRSEEQSASTLRELIAELEVAQGNAKGDADRAALAERLADARQRLVGKQDRISELRQQLAGAR